MPCVEGQNEKRGTGYLPCVDDRESGRSEPARSLFLRYALEQHYGIDLNGQSHFLRPYIRKLYAGDKLSREETSRIEEVISSHDDDGLALRELEDLCILSCEMDCLLRNRKLRAYQREKVRSMFLDVQTFRGLTNDQMEFLEDIARRNGSYITPVRFRANQARIETFRRFSSLSA